MDLHPILVRRDSEFECLPIYAPRHAFEVQGSPLKTKNAPPENAHIMTRTNNASKSNYPHKTHTSNRQHLLHLIVRVCRCMYATCSHAVCIDCALLMRSSRISHDAPHGIFHDPFFFMNIPVFRPPPGRNHWDILRPSFPSPGFQHLRL